MPSLKFLKSLSARRAWIEILYQLYDTYAKVVALRKESVDRNTQRRDFKALGLPSLSARRAWIEIPLLSLLSRAVRSLSARRAWIEMPSGPRRRGPVSVALRKESVDRNAETV